MPKLNLNNLPDKRLDVPNDKNKDDYNLCFYPFVHT